MTLIQNSDNLPIQLPTELVARQDLLDQINQRLSPEQAVLLYGSSGVGKHTTAAMLARRYLDIGGRVLWLSGEDVQILAQQVLAAYNSHSIDLSKVTPLLEQHAPLIILETPHQVAAQFIWTYSRNKTPVIAIHEIAADGPWEPMLVRRLDEATSRQFFIDLTTAPASDKLDQLLKHLDGHPLLLRLTALHLTQPIITLSRLLVMLPPVQESIEQRAKSVIGILFRLLDQTNQGLLMAMSASFAPNISADLLGKLLGVSEQVTLSFSQLLIERGFVTYRNWGGILYYQIHPLIKTFASEQLNDNARLHETQKRMVEAVIGFLNVHSSLSHSSDYQALHLGIAHIFGAARYCLDHQYHNQLNRLIQATNPIEKLLQEWGYLSQWEQIKTQLNQNVVEAQSIDDLDVATEIPSVLIATQPSAHTAVIIRDELQIAFDAAVINHNVPEMARLSLVMGERYMEQGKADSSLHHLRAAVALYQELGDLINLLDALEQLATGCLRFDEPEAAEKYLSQGMNIARQLDDKSSFGRLLTIRGDAQVIIGDENSAGDAYKRAVKVLRACNDPLNTGITLGKLAALYMDQGRYREAAAALTRTVSIFDQIDRRDLMGRALGNLGTAQGYLKRWKEAGERHAAALKIARELQDREEERFQLLNLAFVAENEQYYNWAVKYNQQALYLALQDRDNLAASEIAFEIGRLLMDDPEGIAQAVILLEHSEKLNAIPETNQLLKEARARLQQRQRSGRPIAPAEADLLVYAARAYPS